MPLGVIDIVVNLFTPHEVASNQTGFDASFTAQVAQWCDRCPDRFSGLAGVDPYRGVAGLKELDHATR